MLIFLIIFAALFFTHLIKMVMSKLSRTTRNRSKFVFAQFFTGIVYTILLFVVSVIVLLIAQHIFLADQFLRYGRNG